MYFVQCSAVQCSADAFVYVEKVAYEIVNTSYLPIFRRYFACISSHFISQWLQISVYEIFHRLLVRSQAIVYYDFAMNNSTKKLNFILQRVWERELMFFFCFLLLRIYLWEIELNDLKLSGKKGTDTPTKLRESIDAMNM